MPDGEADGARHFQDFFSDPEAIAGYADGPPPFVPGFRRLASHDRDPPGRDCAE
jgi:hypothetical protein